MANLISAAVTYFNNLPADQRTIGVSDTVIVTIHHAMPAVVVENQKLRIVEGEYSEQPPTLVGDSLGLTRFLWVAGPGKHRIATNNSFIPISTEQPSGGLSVVRLIIPEEKYSLSSAFDSERVLLEMDDQSINAPSAPALITAMGPDPKSDEVWLFDPHRPAPQPGDASKQLMRLRPVYSMEQFVFSLPRLDASILPPPGAGLPVIFGAFRSLKRIAFDPVRTKVALTYVPTPSQNLVNTGSQITLKLYHTTASSPPAVPMGNETRLLAISFYPHNPTGYNVYKDFESTFGPSMVSGFKGVFYWEWNYANHDALDPAGVIDGLSITLYTPTRNEDLDQITPPMNV